MIVHESQLYQPPASLTDDDVALIEPAAVGLHAAMLGLPKAGEKVLVVGCGILGLMLLQALRALAPESEVMVLARHGFQGELALDLGASDVYVGGDGDRVTQEKMGARYYEGAFGSKMLLGGFDVVFDCVGTSATLTEAVRWARAGGSVVAVGIQYKIYRSDLSPLYYQELRLLGTWGYAVEKWHGELVDAFELAARLAENGELKFGGLITHRFPLSEWREAVRVSVDKKKHRSVKVALSGLP
jgi:threonine dehydrogenase-like Zn-dependent dehydrogenase